MIMINEKLTEKEYGYNINTLKPSSCKTVVWNCLQCDIRKDKKYRQAKKRKFLL